MNRPDPRQFGRRRIVRQLTQEQRSARFCIVGGFILFVSALGACFGTDSDGGRVLLGMLAFGALVLCIAAAEEA